MLVPVWYLILDYKENADFFVSQAPKKFGLFVLNSK
jgi:hypothetical protein